MEVKSLENVLAAARNALRTFRFKNDQDEAIREFQTAYRIHYSLPSDSDCPHPISFLGNRGIKSIPTTFGLYDPTPTRTGRLSSGRSNLVHKCRWCDFPITQRLDGVWETTTVGKHVECDKNPTSPYHDSRVYAYDKAEQGAPKEERIRGFAELEERVLAHLHTTCGPTGPIVPKSEDNFTTYYGGKKKSKAHRFLIVAAMSGAVGYWLGRRR